MNKDQYNQAGENDVTLKDGRRKNWFWDYNSVFKSNLSAHAKLVRLYLSQCANRDRVAWPSLKTIADSCGISRATAKRAVSELVEEGWLQKILRRKESGEYISNAFVLCDPPEEFKREVDQHGGRVVQTLPCNELTGGVGSERTGVGSHGTGVGSGRAINNTDITILKEQYGIATSHPSSHHDKDNNARARSGKCFPVDSLDFVDNHDDSIYLHKNAESNCQGLQTINSLLKSAGFEASQVEVEFVGRWISLFPQEMIEYALNKSVLNGKKNLYYVEAIIDSWLEKGIRTLEEARKETRYDNYVKFVKPFG